MSLKLDKFSAGYRSWKTCEVTMEIPTHGLTGLLGLNGSGKSTLLKGMMGLIQHRGSLIVDGKEIGMARTKERALQFSYLPQRYQFAYPISVEDVILMGFNPEMSLFEQYSQEQRDKARTVLSQMGLEEMLQADFTHLSEGQRQRIMLARSLVQDTAVLLLDEPDSAMDFSVQHDVMHLIQTIIRRDQRCGLVILHDPSLALKFCDRIELFQDGQIKDSIIPALDDGEVIRQKLNQLFGSVAVYPLPEGRFIVDMM